MEAVPERFELTRDERIWLVTVPVEVAAKIAEKVRELSEEAEWLSGASVGEIGDGSYYLSATYYREGELHSHRPIFHVTAERAVQVTWDDIDQLRAAASLKVVS